MPRTSLRPSDTRQAICKANLPRGQIDCYSHYDGDGDDPPGPADLDVGGIEPEVGPFAFQWPIQKGINPLVDLATKPRNLAFRHAGHAPLRRLHANACRATHGLDQVID